MEFFHIKTQCDWDKIFAENHMHGWGKHSSMLISKVKPKGDGSPRSIYEEDKKMILQSAKKYGYIILHETPTIICFFNNKLKGGNWPNI